MVAGIQLDLDRLLPEFVVAGTAMGAIVAELLLPAGRRAVATAWTGVLGLVVALVLLLTATPQGMALSLVAPTRVGGGVAYVLVTGWASDAFSIYVRALVLIVGIVLFLLSMPWWRRMDRGHGEMTALLLFCLLGVMLVSGVQDFLSLFVCLEVVTILAYVLVAFRRSDVRSVEAGLKYLVVGAVSTAFLLLGIAFVYGHVGSLGFDALQRAMLAGETSAFLSLGLALVWIGLLFKIGGVPFHVWIPDVYEGAPTPSTAFLATASKAAGVVLLLKLGAISFAGSSSPPWVALLAVVAVATLLFGSLGAIAQRQFQRMMGYSGIGHAGWLLFGLVAMAAAMAVGRSGEPAVTALLYYLAAYVLTGATAFAVMVLVSGACGGRLDAPVWRGLHRRSPFLALAMLIALLSLAGVPPTGGFFAKFLVLGVLVQEGHYALAFLGALLVVVGLYFYFLWLRDIWFREPDPTLGPDHIHVPLPSRIAIGVGIAAMLGLGIFMGPFYEWAAQASRALLS